MIGEHQEPLPFPDPVVCWEWHLRDCGPDRYRIGKQCFCCRKDVAAPADAKRPICIGCGMERNLVPMVEIPPGDDPSPFPWCNPRWTINLKDLKISLLGDATWSRKLREGDLS